MKGLGIRDWGPVGAVAALIASATIRAQPAEPDWKALEGEIMQQFQAVLRFDTRNPPGNEHLVAAYLKGVFDQAWPAPGRGTLAGR